MRFCFSICALLGALVVAAPASPIAPPLPVEKRSRPAAATAATTAAPSVAEQAVAETLKRIEAQNIDRLARLSTSTRSRDPFGLGMSEELDVKPLVKEPALSAREGAQEKPQLPVLSDAVRELKITGVNPSAGEFYVGARIIQEGEVLALRHHGLVFSTRVLEVSARAVIWEDLSNGTRAITRLGIIPEIVPAEPTVLSTLSSELSTDPAPLPSKPSSLSSSPSK